MCVCAYVHVCVCVCGGVGVCMHVCVCLCGSMLLLTSPLTPSPTSPAHQSLDGCLGVALCEEDGEQRKAEQSPCQALGLVRAAPRPPSHSCHCYFHL